jgi:hypothetical protein
VSRDEPLFEAGPLLCSSSRDHDWNGEHRGPQRSEDWNRDRPAFSDRDREVTREWYFRNQRHLGRGWTSWDRLPPDMERRLRRGERLDPRLRRQMYWLPAELTRRYGPAPRGFRYAIIGGNIVMLDRDYRVYDVFRLDIQIR